MNRLNGKNEEDRRIYERSARLLLLLALRDIAPGAKARFEHSIGRGIYLNVSGVSLTASLVRRIEARMHELSRANLPIVQSRWTREQAVEYFRAQGQEDTVRLLTYRPFDYFDVYTCDGLSEYFYGGMVESTAKSNPLPCGFITQAWYCCCQMKTFPARPRRLSSGPSSCAPMSRRTSARRFCNAKTQPI